MRDLVKRSMVAAVLLNVLPLATGCVPVAGGGSGTPGQAAATGRTLTPEQRQRLGEDLLRAAERRDWATVKHLLARGADPNVVVLPPPPGPVINPGWRWRVPHASALHLAAGAGKLEIMRLLLAAGADIEGRTGGGRSSPLMFAIENRQVAAIRLLLSRGANVMYRRTDNHNVVDVARFSGSDPVIRLLENAARVPAWDRSVPAAPFAPGARAASPRLIRGTVGAVPVRQALWVSPRELLVLRENPRTFSLVNIETGKQTPLPALSRRWAAQTAFDPQMLAVSPGGGWLVGFGGTPKKPTWLATPVRGGAAAVAARSQEWARDTVAGSMVTGDRVPPFAWINERRWVEWRGGYTPLRARVRTLGRAGVEEMPVRGGSGAYDGHPSTVFSFDANGKAGHTSGPVGWVGDAPSAPKPGDQYQIAWLCDVFPGPAGWRAEDRQIIVRQAEQAGYFTRCVRSPRGDRLAWRSQFSASEASALLVSDANGRNLRVVYEHLYPLRDYKTGRAAAPQSLNWTPGGDGLVFWRGEKGENGLCLLPIASER